MVKVRHMTAINVPILKGGKDAFLEVDIDAIPSEMFSLVVLEGLKALLNARMSKVGAVTKLEGKELAEAHAHALKIAGENKEKLLAGTIKSKSKAAKSDVPREVQTEARRIARELVKNEMRKAGIKPSMVAASDITKAADAMIAADPTIIAKARENLDSRANISSVIDVSAIIKEDPKKVAKAKADADAKKASLSAKQAGLVKPRKRGDAPHHAVH